MTDCFDWLVTQQFHFEHRGLVNLRIDFTRYPCTQSFIWSWNNFLWINFLLLFLCTIHMLLSIKYIHNIGQRFKKLKKRYQESYHQMTENEHEKRAKEAKNNQSYVSKRQSSLTYPIEAKAGRDI